MIFETITQVWSLNGLVFVIAAAFVAGLVRGFAGFGTAMIFLPVAGQYLDPITAIAALTVMDFFGPIPIVRPALRDAYKPDLVRLLLGLMITLPFALMLLVRMDTQVFRYAVSVIAIVLVIVLATGWRYSGQLRPSMLLGLGCVSGVTGGLAGVPGPPVILFYMASRHPARIIRANNLLFLFGYDILVLMFFALIGTLSAMNVVLGIVLAIPIGIGNIIGAAIFNPEKEKVYRRAAFLIIAISAINGLPVWD